jgi:hypothetical protein
MKRPYFQKISGANSDLVNLDNFRNIAKFGNNIYWAEVTGNILYIKYTSSLTGATSTLDSYNVTTGNPTGINTLYSIMLKYVYHEVENTNYLVAAISFKDNNTAGYVISFQYNLDGDTSVGDFETVIPIGYTIHDLLVLDTYFVLTDYINIVYYVWWEYSATPNYFIVSNRTVNGLFQLSNDWTVSPLQIADYNALWVGHYTRDGNDGYYRFIVEVTGGDFRLYHCQSTSGGNSYETLTGIVAPTSYNIKIQQYWRYGLSEIMMDTDHLYFRWDGGSWVSYFTSGTLINGIIWDKDYLGNPIITFLLWGSAIWEITDKGTLKKIQALEPRDYKKIYLSNKNEDLTGVVQFVNRNGKKDLDAWTSSNLTTSIALVSGHRKALKLTATAANGEIYYPYTTDTDSIDDIWVFIPTANQFNLKYREDTTEVFSLSFLAGNITVTDAGGTSGTVATYIYGKWIHIKIDWIKSGALNITIDNELVHTGTIGAYDINRTYIILATNETYCAIDSFGQGLNSYVSGSNKKINAYVGYGSDIGEAWFSTGDSDTSIMQLSFKDWTKGTLKSLVISEIYKAPQYSLARNTEPFEDEWIKQYTDAEQLFYEGKVKDNNNDNRFYWKYLMKSWQDEYEESKITVDLSTYNHGNMLKYILDNKSKYLWHGRGTNADVNEFTANQINGTDSGWTNSDGTGCLSSYLAKKGFANDFLYHILKQYDNGVGACIVDYMISGKTVISGWFASDDVTKQIKIEFYESATRIGYLEINASNIRWYDGVANVLVAAVNDTDYHWALVFSATDDDVDVYINGVFDSTQSFENNITTEITKIRWTTDTTTVGPRGCHAHLFIDIPPPHDNL